MAGTTGWLVGISTGFCGYIEYGWDGPVGPLYSDSGRAVGVVEVVVMLIVLAGRGSCEYIW